MIRKCAAVLDSRSRTRHWNEPLLCHGRRADAKCSVSGRVPILKKKKKEEKQKQYHACQRAPHRERCNLRGSAIVRFWRGLGRLQFTFLDVAKRLNRNLVAQCGAVCETRSSHNAHIGNVLKRGKADGYVEKTQVVQQRRQVGLKRETNENNIV